MASQMPLRVRHHPTHYLLGVCFLAWAPAHESQQRRLLCGTYLAQLPRILAYSVARKTKVLPY